MAPNGQSLIDELEFIERIKKLPPEERTIEMARVTYTLVDRVEALNTKFDSLTIVGINKRSVATTSGITTATIIAFVEGIRVLLGR